VHVLTDFQYQKHNHSVSQKFLVLENDNTKFQDFPGLPGDEGILTVRVLFSNTGKQE